MSVVVAVSVDYVVVSRYEYSVVSKPLLEGGSRPDGQVYPLGAEGVPRGVVKGIGGLIPCLGPWGGRRWSGKSVDRRLGLRRNRLALSYHSSPYCPLYPPVKP